jgi:membrane fusion protein (multidrug efflux system)
VVVLEAKPVTTGSEFIGRVQAVSQVEIRARVEGFLEQQLFDAGQEVTRGQLLYIIEKSLFQAQVDQFKADVAAAEAQLANAESQYQRALTLVRSQNMPEAEVDTRRAARDAARAQVLLAQAQLKQAEINLGYTEIASPIDGKIGLSTFDVGNLVSPSSGPLATIVSQDPMYVVFPVSQRELLALRDEQHEGAKGGLANTEVVLRFADGTTYPYKAAVDFTAPQVDPTTDTVTVRATVANPDRVLIAGQYANVLLQEQHPQQRLVVPQAAVQVNQQGVYVLTVDERNEVELTPVELGQSQGTDIVITRGLEAGDRVIVDGLQKVRPGQVVQAQAASPAPMPGVATQPSQGAPGAGQKLEQPPAAGGSAPAPATGEGRQG